MKKAISRNYYETGTRMRGSNKGRCRVREVIEDAFPVFRQGESKGSK
jgi:hypothetical protein